MITSESVPLMVITAFHVLCSVSGEHVKNNLSREKRTLIWPVGVSKILVITGFGIPVDLKRETVIIGTVIKGNYKLPTNVSQIRDQYIIYERKKRAASRWDLYGLLSQAIQMRGFEGKSCLLRAICEVASTPLEKNHGLFHELIHVFFTPTSTSEKISHHTDNEYYAAQALGETNGKCDRIFHDCSTSLMDMFTVYKNKIDL